MPVEGLPLALETMFDTLLHTNKLSTWRVTGGENHIAVTLRFNMAAIGDCIPGGIGSASYRKMPPSQQKCNHLRRQRWLEEKSKQHKQSSSISELKNDSGEIITLDWL